MGQERTSPFSCVRNICQWFTLKKETADCVKERELFSNKENLGNESKQGVST